MRLLVPLALVVSQAAAGGGAAPLVAQTIGDRVRYETEHAVVFFVAGELASVPMERFVRLVERGITDIEKTLGDTPPAAEAVRKITYRIAGNIEIASTYRRTVLLPLERVKVDRAPYLHETTHALMRSRNDCLWLDEGFASFVQSFVAENVGGYDGYVFSMGGNKNVDRLARRHLASEAGKAVLPYVGGRGTPEELWQERRQVAEPFYVMSHSFVKHLVERAGLPCVRDLLRAEDVSAALERSTGHGLAQWKSEWLAALEKGRAGSGA